MTHVSGSSWRPERENGGTGAPIKAREDFDHNQRGKPIKAVIGVALLVILALALSRMHPVPHDAANPPSITTGQATGTDAR